MKFYLLLFSVLVFTNAFAQLTDREIYDLKGGRVANDTSYVYWLPYESGKSYWFVQGANSKMSHRNELSYDFKMKEGSKICAARGGIVVSVRGDSNKGGLKQENLGDGNYIIIQHNDDSRAHYWHLQTDGIAVKEGDTVLKGQLIGFSGNTGYSAFPHLHFQVRDAQNREILVRFQTKKGIKYLRPAKWYKKPTN
jgi:murein DD-endopeptidase MepM/ murein hydrolase activator NlpD